MPLRKIKKGDKLLVDFEVEVQGTMYNHLVQVEGQYVLTTNNKAKNYPIFFYGGTLEIWIAIAAVPNSTLKKLVLKINGVTGINHKDLLFRGGVIEIRRPFNLSEFNLEEI